MNTFCGILLMMLTILVLSSESPTQRDVDEVPSSSKSLSRSQLSRALQATASASLDASSHVVRLTDNNYDEVLSQPDKFIVVLYYALWNSRSNKFVTDFVAASNHFQLMHADLVFAALHVPTHQSLGGRAGIRNYPEVAMISHGNMDNPQLYCGHHWHAKELIEFIEKTYVRDQYKRNQKLRMAAKHAEENIEHPNPGFLVELSETNFDSFIKNTKKLTFVIFYAPWCDSCKEPLSVLKHVAEYYTLDRNVLIAKVNGDENGNLVSRFQIEGYPTQLLFAKPKMAKKGMVYRGDPATTDIEAYIDTHNRFEQSDEMPDELNEMTMEQMRSQMQVPRQ